MECARMVVAVLPKLLQLFFYLNVCSEFLFVSGLHESHLASQFHQLPFYLLLVLSLLITFGHQLDLPLFIPTDFLAQLSALFSPVCNFYAHLIYFAIQGLHFLFEGLKLMCELLVLLEKCLVFGLQFEALFIIFLQFAEDILADVLILVYLFPDEVQLARQFFIFFGQLDLKLVTLLHFGVYFFELLSKCTVLFLEIGDFDLKISLFFFEEGGCIQELV